MTRHIEKLKSEAAGLSGTDRQIALSLIRLEGKMDHFADRVISGVSSQLVVVQNRLDNLAAEIQASRRERTCRESARLKGRRP